ncbi:hypothetical protein BGZ65_003360, partial [Modicella reniformis]
MTSVVTTAISTKVHSFVRQSPVTSSSFQASQARSGRGEHNGRVSVQPTAFDGGLLVGLYDPHLGPQCAEYLQQHLIPILDESLSTQLDHSDNDDNHPHQSYDSTSTSKIDPTQVIDTLKSTFKELDELLLATAITVALTQPETIEQLESEEEVRKTQEVIAQVVTGSTALVGFLAPRRVKASSSTATKTTTAAEITKKTTTTGGGGGGEEGRIQRSDFYLAQLGDSVAILAGYDAQGQWTAQRLNPPETYEHSIRYPGSEEYHKVILDAKERALTVEQYLTQHSSSSTTQESNTHHRTSSSITSIDSNESFLTRNGKFLGLPVTRAFGDLDWKLEQEARFSVATWVEKSLRAKIDQALGGGQLQEQQQDLQDEASISNLNDPPYVSADPKVSRLILETRKPSSNQHSQSGPSDQLLIFLSRELLYTTKPTSDGAAASASAGKVNPYDQSLISDFELSRVVANTLERAEENCAWAVAKTLDEARMARNGGVIDRDDEEEGREGSVVVVV